MCLRVSQVEQELLTLLEHMSYLPVLVGSRCSVVRFRVVYL